jgi:ankyrin repeat protein
MKRNLVIGLPLVIVLGVIGFGLTTPRAEGGRDRNAADRALIAAIKIGDAAAVTRLLAEGANANAVSADDARRPTALMLAARGASLEIVKALLAHKADVRGVDTVETNALMQAAEVGHTAAIQELLNAGAVVNATNKFDDTALITAAKFGHTEAARLLLAAGADLAAEKRQVFDLVWLRNLLGLDEGTPIYSSDVKDAASREETAADGRVVVKSNAFVVALVHNRIETARFLLERGSPVAFMGNRSGAEALKFAARRGQLPLVESLLALKVSVNDPGRNGRTALAEAARFGHESVVKALLAKGAKVEARDAGGLTALLVAARAGHVPSITTLLGAGANVEATDNRGSTALMLAAEAGHDEAVRVLLGSGAKAKTKDKLGRTAAQRAEDTANTQVANALTEKDARGRAKDDGMWP